MKTICLLITTFIILQFIVSCSNEPSVEKKSNEFSTNTEKEFADIENGEAPKSTKSTPPSSQKKSRLFHERTTAPVIIGPAKEVQKKEKLELIPNEQLSSKNQERLQEINQNLTFYCMKHRKDSAFSSEENCLNFTKRVLADCEKKHKLINTIMVNCIKERLKKKK